MSAATLPAQVGVSLGRVVRSEWTKLWSLRSTRWALLVSVVAMAGLGILVSAVQMAHWTQMSPRDQATFDPVDTSLGGWHLAQLAIGVLGVLLITGEYSTLPLEELLSIADVVTLHLPLSNETKGILSAERLKLMRPSACIINTARGALIDQPALREALQAERLGGFAADVLDEEPPDPDDSLIQNPRVLLTPHVASLTSATYREMCIFTAQNVVAVLEGRTPVEQSVFRSRV